MTDFRTLRKNVKKRESLSKKVNVSLLGDSATQFLASAIIGTGVERGFNINLYEADYNQIEQQISDPNSDFYKHKSEYTIVFQSTHKLLECYNMMDPTEYKTLADRRLSFIRTICDNVKQKIIYFNYPEIDDTVFGSYANKVISSFLFQVRKLNYELMGMAQEFENLFICDIAGIQNTIGRNNMFDASVYTNTEMLISVQALPFVASRVLDIICSIEGQFKKCLIVDLDNTLWGGIVGEDGWENLQIGHGLGIGKVYTEFQEWIKKLKNRGIIICVCSKNDEEKAKDPFLYNPEMVLTLDEISVFVANWDNKADNIRSIHRILNIGYDSMVFLDDNPFERNLVKESIPEITVPDLPEDPEKYLEYLYSLNLFETASFSKNDQDRTKQYQDEAKRVSSLQEYTDTDDFLKNLNMVSKVSSFTKFNIPRIAQLSQRSNQFNLRTIRYTEDQIAKIETDALQQGFAFTLSDRFGDNGLISVVILKDCNNSEETIPPNLHNMKSTLFIDTWLMSCRVLKRGMENYVLNTIVSWAKCNGYDYLIGEYIPTSKNELVANHYSNMGFKVYADSDNHCGTQWILNVDAYKERTCYICDISDRRNE